MEQDKSDINDWFLIQAPVVQKNSEIISADIAGPMYHIDKVMPLSLIPRMPQSAASSENTTTARVTVAPTLIGCIIGYARTDHDVLYSMDYKSKKKEMFKGGYIISEIRYKHCAKPNDKLVYDASKTGEHWLVSYNKESLTYMPVEIGKVFISSILTQSVSGKEPIKIFTIYITHTKEAGILFCDKKLLLPGFYKAELTFNSHDTRSTKNESDFIVTKCTASEYMSAKNLAAAMLNLEAPNFTKW